MDSHSGQGTLPSQLAKLLIKARQVLPTKHRTYSTAFGQELRYERMFLNLEQAVEVYISTRQNND